MNEQRTLWAKFVLFWLGTVTVATGLSYALKGTWYIFVQWFQINFPTLAGIHDPANASELSGGMARAMTAYMPDVALGSGVLIVGIFMMLNGKKQIAVSKKPLVHFGLFWAGAVALAAGLGFFLFGLTAAAFAVWSEINFPTEFWVEPTIPRGLWFPQLRYNMPYVLDGLVMLLLSLFMMKNGQRKLD